MHGSSGRTATVVVLWREELMSPLAVSRRGFATRQGGGVKFGGRVEGGRRKEIVTFVLDEKTIYRQGKTKVIGKLPKAGERVVVSAMPVDAGKMMTAVTVQLPVPVTAAR